jgi:hypothetical protein
MSGVAQDAIRHTRVQRAAGLIELRPAARPAVTRGGP